MDTGGTFDFGDLPEEEGAGGEAPFNRGWLAPEDRLWRHPSEMSLSAQGTATRSTRAELWRSRRAPIAAGTLGAAAVAAAAALMLALSNPPTTTASNSPLKATYTSLVTVPSVAPGIISAVSALRPSLVELVPAGTSERSPVTGVVLPGGNLIVTSANAATGVSRMEVVTSGGRRLSGKVLASDQEAGVAVVATKGGLYPASFANEVVYPGELAFTACLRSASPGSPVPSTDVAVGMVQESDGEVSVGHGTELMDAIEAATPISSRWGGVLLDGHGDVIGILDEQRDGTGGRVGVFVPASLAVGVADELAWFHRVEHGWIGVEDTDAPDDSGASIVEVESGSPAASAGIEPGDVVTAVDGQPVLSYADLDARLYTIPPGEEVTLTVDRGGSLTTVSVVPAAH